MPIQANSDMTLDGVPTPTSDESPDAALLLAYSRETEIPAPLEKWYRAFEQDRMYVNDTCMKKDAEDCVGTNHILRNQYVLSALLNSRNADFRIEPCEAMWPPVPQMDPMLGIPTGAMLPGEAPPELEGFAKTQELLAKRLLREARFRQQLRGAIQDIETNAIVFIKVNQQQDLARDPIGAMRFNDQQDNFALYKYWQAKVAKGDITEGSAEMSRFKEIEETCRTYLIASLHEQMQQSPMAPQFGAQPPAPAMPAMSQPAPDPAAQPAPDAAMGMGDSGLPPAPQPAPIDPRQGAIDALKAGGPIDPVSVPEIASWIGLPIDIIMPEDIRFTWNITRPEDFYRSQRVQHRVFYDADAFAAKFGLTPEEMEKVPKAGSTSQSVSVSSGDPSARDEQLDDKKIAKQIEVWECWDRQTNYVCTYVKGYPKKLQSYIPTVVWRNWFPIIPVLFNRVTGRFVGISSTTLQRPLQDEINIFRTHERHAKKACFPRILVKKGALTRTEAQKYKRALPYEVIEVQDPDELKQAIMETQPVAYNPALYDNTKAEMDLQRMAGVSLVTGGAVGASNSATEVAEASQGVDLLSDYKKGILEDVYEDVITCMLDMAVTIFPEENVKALVGPGAVWPPVGREAMWRNTQIVIRAGSTGKPDKRERMEFFSNASQIARNAGLVVKGPELMDEIAKETGYNGRLSRFFQVAPPPMPGMTGPPGGPPGGPPKASGGSPPSSPSPDSQQGEGGGRPPGGAPAPESIPNHPQLH